MPNSTEQEILNAHKYKNIKKSRGFQAQISLQILFFLLINVEMPTIVGILTFMRRKKFVLRPTNFFITSQPNLAGKTASRFDCAMGHNQMWLWLQQGNKKAENSHNMEFWAQFKASSA